MERQRKILIAKSAVVLAAIPVLIYAHAAGPDPRNTGAPGDTTCADVGCHGGGKVNVGGGNVAVSFPNGLSYTPGVTQQLTVTITDSAAKVYGFQLTARLASNLANGQAGDLNPLPGDSVFVLCDDGSVKSSGAPCPALFPVEFIEQTRRVPRKPSPSTGRRRPPMSATSESTWLAMRRTGTARPIPAITSTRQATHSPRPAANRNRPFPRKRRGERGQLPRRHRGRLLDHDLRHQPLRDHAHLAERFQRESASHPTHRRFSHHRRQTRVSLLHQPDAAQRPGAG